MLLCPVRDCHLPLLREQRRVVCARAHSFDIARSGYINLLQPQERRSKHPGDTRAAIQARGQLHERGINKPLLDAIASAVQPANTDVILDAGCGQGYYLGNLARQFACAGHGVDISAVAIDAAARVYPECQWVVANADRFIPYADRSFSAVLSITARMNVSEFRRVLRDDGRLLIAIPSPEDLIELRGQADSDRAERTIATFAEEFTLVSQKRATSTADLDAAAVEDVLHAIYRPLRAQPVQAMRVTFSLELLLFKPKS